VAPLIRVAPIVTLKSSATKKQGWKKNMREMEEKKCCKKIVLYA
jgi:hypothetical protein